MRQNFISSKIYHFASILLKYADTTIQDGYRNLELNSNHVHDCIQIIQRTFGFVLLNNVNPDEARRYPGANGKLITGDTVKDYHECLRQNDKLNEKKLLQLTKEVLQLKLRYIHLLLYQLVTIRISTIM